MQEKTAIAEGNSVKKSEVSEGDYFSDFDFKSLEIRVEDMFRSGVHFGHQKSRKNPKMDPYIFTTRNGINILDLEKTAAKLKETLKFIEDTAAEGKEILFVGTKKQAKKLIRSAAAIVEMPYVSERWLGGTFTNFSVISGRTKHLRESEEKMEKGEYVKYTKFEQMKFKEEIERLERRMGGIKNMTKLPGAIFAISVIDDRLAIKESVEKNIPVVAICDTNSNPDKVDYMIPANEDAVSSLKLILAYVIKAVLSGKEKMKSAASAKDSGEQKKK
jgi:small subunit ribosomal protein S2